MSSLYVQLDSCLLTETLPQVDCVEAIFNLGLVNIHLGLPGDSLQAFEKLHTIIPNNTEVIYHIANLYEVRYHMRLGREVVPLMFVILRCARVIAGLLNCLFCLGQILV